MRRNDALGYILRTKSVKDNDGGVAAGVAVLDTPALVAPVDERDPEGAITAAIAATQVALAAVAEDAAVGSKRAAADAETSAAKRHKK